MNPNDKYIFLSAGIPSEDRNPKYYDTANPMLIMDAIMAVSYTVFSKKYKLLCGAQPAIVPFLESIGKEFIEEQKETNLPLIKVYQSKYFDIPEDTLRLEEQNIAEIFRIEPNPENDREGSLEKMRREMFNIENIQAAIFIGGMEGIEDEFELFKKIYPTKPLYVLGAPGGAALCIIQEKLEKMKQATNRNSVLSELNSQKNFPYLAMKIMGDIEGFRNA